MQTTDRSLSTEPIAPAPPSNARSLMRTMAERFGMEAAAFERTLMETIMPRNTPREAVAAFLVVAHEHGLNPFTREIFAFEGQGGGVRPIVSIDGWIRIVNEHPQNDGYGLLEIFDEKGNLVAVEATFRRKDRAHPIVLREYLSECLRPTEPWKRWPRRMLRHKAFIQGARYAFGFAGIEDEDEVERFQEATRGSNGSHLPAAGATKLRDLVPQARVEPARTVEARAETVKPTPEPTKAEPVHAADPSPAFGDEDLPASDEAIVSHWYSGIEIFPDSFPDGWQRGRVSTKAPLDAFTFETIAASTDPKVMASVAGLLKLGAEKQAAEGKVPVQFQQLAQALHAHAESEIRS